MPKKTMRVLNVVGKMDRAGVETWLMHLLRNIDRQRFQIDFCSNTADPGAYDAELQALGSRIYRCLEPSQPFLYARNFNRILRSAERYDVVHSHVHHFSGFVLKLAHDAGVKTRIAHSHCATAPLDERAHLLRKGYLALSRHLISTHATAGFACSSAAAPALFGGNWEEDPRWRVLYYGVDFAPFGKPGDRREVRRGLGIPDDAIVLGHVGRFADQKNHEFLIDVAAAAMRKEPRVRLLLVGDGTLRSKIETKVLALGIREKTTFAGTRADIPIIMSSAMDVFVFPSHYEGLGLVLVESQAAGLGCVISDTITREADVVPDRVKRLGLEDSPDLWAENCLKMAAAGRDKDALTKVKASRFSHDKGMRVLCEAYEGSLHN